MIGSVQWESFIGISSKCLHTSVTTCTISLFQCAVAQENVSQSSLHCPICRFRISVWCRQATKTNTLVAEKLWIFLQVVARFFRTAGSQELKIVIVFVT